MARLCQTPSQTIGPFFRPSLLRSPMNVLAHQDARGELITIEGRVIDGAGAPVDDAMIEIWHANAAGRYDHPEDVHEKPLDPAFHGFGRAATDENGWFRFRTVRPGAVAGHGGAVQAPHINVSIFARGLLKRLVTRIYFPGEPLNAGDWVLNTAAADRRETLIARTPESGTSGVFRFDVVLQGAGETVFFAV
jgi:protocatechuate 3,4-dioxygenase, alpha subunit